MTISFTSALTILSLLASNFASPVPAPDSGITIPLTKKYVNRAVDADGSVDLAWVLATSQQVSNKYHANLSAYEKQAGKPLAGMTSIAEREKTRAGKVAKRASAGCKLDLNARSVFQHSRGHGLLINQHREDITLLCHFLKEGVVSTGTFAFRLTSSGSELYLGGVDSSKYTGAVTYTPVTQQTSWQVALGAVTVNSNNVVTSTSAIIDTGTTLIYAPTTVASTFYGDYPNATPLSTFGYSSTTYTGYYAVPCTGTSYVAFTFGGVSYTIPTSIFTPIKLKPDRFTDRPIIIRADADPDPIMTDRPTGFVACGKSQTTAFARTLLRIARLGLYWVGECQTTRRRSEKTLCLEKGKRTATSALTTIPI
ncbi:aspartic peptidase domain-containing protein [Naematelia encephala]|uniref:Aspartic peptidase domain-containing protein n=1 Tax=Naematelia encephala TaxID=71784 RepID=A0A1Y2AJW0_9TREE|nr:aspartic peptidase domain-containing protein [Naematelia encephala]